MALIQCPECQREISSAAAACPGCGHPIRMISSQQRPMSSGPPVAAAQWSPGIAALLSFVIPGAGQMYKGAIGAGIVWFICTSIGYVLLIVPGLILHLICIFHAASGDPSRS